MIERKYGERSNWKRILERKFAQSFINTKEFIGYITLLHTVQVTEPLFMDYQNKDLCIVNNDYMWLQHFPLEKNYSITTMFDENGSIVQWYIDICVANGITNGKPWLDDLFLDIIVLPSGEIIIKDEDELENALLNGIIDKSLYDLAWNEVKKLTNLINTGNFELLKLSENHKNLLIDLLK